ncbi:MAG: SLC13 family permease [Planctomycetota bacterium]
MSGKSWAMLGGVVFAILVWLATTAMGLPPKACATAGITALTAVWWVTEALPIPATSLVPLAGFPIVGVLDNQQIAGAYGHRVVLLLLGGFIFSKSIERSGAHRRMALRMVSLFGGLGRRGLVLGFMLATAASSMWISNTATVLMLLPVAQAILAQDKDGQLKIPLLLGIAYAASIGGMGTPIGTPPNLQLRGVYEAQFGETISFLEWMTWGIPVVIILLPIAWFILSRSISPGPMLELPPTGRWRPAEKRVAVVFVFTACAWIFRSAPFGGWAGLTGMNLVGDETIALTAVIVLFVMPNGEGERMLDWETAVSIPWGLLLLFGGGLAIAAAFKESQLSDAIGDGLKSVVSMHPIIVVGTICLAVTFLTEITSNTATTALLMPIMLSAAVAANLEPKLLMVPAAISSSCAFMLPVATAPNAVMFGTGEIPIRRMARIGVWINFCGVLVITSVCVLVLGSGPGSD